MGGINLGHVRDSHLIPPDLKGKINKLKNQKLKFYDNAPDRQFRTPEALQNEEKSLFLEILTARQQQIKEEINRLRRKIEGPSEKRIGLFDGKVEEKPFQIELDAPGARERIEELDREYRQLEQSKTALQTGSQSPFVWDIAFVEIFEEEKGGFDIVVGNPPYVRQEVIAAPVIQGHRLTADKKIYKEKLANSVYRAFPRFSGYNRNTGSVAHKLDAKSDLYIYFYFRSLSLLNKKGSFCFITSNSWLDAGYGADLQEFLLRHSQFKLVLDNQNKRTFANADVNSVIVLLVAPDDKTEWGLEKIARFTMFKVPFENILDPVIMQEIDEAGERKSTREYRILPIRQDRLLLDGCEVQKEDTTETYKNSGPLIKITRYIGNKWGGKYLKAPDIWYRINDLVKDRTVNLGQLVKGQRYLNTVYTGLREPQFRLV
ncbi:MAG: Eco57I restriction-modification methylase domain-containing protein [Dehalococcoidales bacterium]|nr:Eco57I restriction-modification methylase domain-containing protein [Dehalococcoidales bacterium]